MPVCEADPWRVQYFENVPCPEDVRIPTEDADAWTWFPKERWVYNKLAVAESQGLVSGPHGVMPDRFPVFSKPIMNLKGMGDGSAMLRSEADYHEAYRAGHMWMALLEGEHVSTDCAVADGRPRWWRHTTGEPLIEGAFDYWIIHAEPRPALEAYLEGWLARQFAGYTGMVNFETIGGKIIEVHLRFADQWPDLYGEGWVEALVRLYAEGRWTFEDRDRRDGYSIILFGRHGKRFFHPSAEHLARVQGMPGVSSLQTTFHEHKAPEAHAMPPGGFRLGIINAYDLEQGFAARRELAKAYPQGAILKA
jgi:hypothetical protein